MRYLTKKENELNGNYSSDSLPRQGGRQRKKFTYEVIIVDDGSTDNTARISMKFVHEYTVRYLLLSVSVQPPVG